jgi:hypothetical protein
MRRRSGAPESSVTLAKESAERTKANRADIEGIVTQGTESSVTLARASASAATFRLDQFAAA